MTPPTPKPAEDKRERVKVPSVILNPSVSRQRNWQLKNIALGLCSRCSSPTSGHTFCESCREKIRARRKKAYHIKHPKARYFKRGLKQMKSSDPIDPASARLDLIRRMKALQKRPRPTRDKVRAQMKAAAEYTQRGKG